MAEIHYIITSIGLIPEVSLYKTKEEARTAWFDNLEDNIEDEEIEESWASGFAEYDDYEFRYGMELVGRIHPEIAPTCEQCGGQIQHAIFDFTFPPENGLCECEDVKEWE